MHGDQWPYRELYDALPGYHGPRPYRDIVGPWVEAHPEQATWLSRLRELRGAPPAISQEDSWRLYALSRILDLLQLSFAPRAVGDGWKLRPVEPREFAEFGEAMGLEAIDRSEFHPFFHEIVTVDQLPDDDARPRITETYWPGYTLGPLLISRAGCRIAAGRHHVVKEVAEHSTLYWAFARHHKPTDDLSVGWGSNSQWRTAFRRDYVFGDTVHYNVDARARPGPEELDAVDRAELIRHRCLVTSTSPHDDLWPYHLKRTENIGDWLA